MWCLIIIPAFYHYRSLGYSDKDQQKPSHMEMVTVQATAGMMAGALSSVITTPIDTIKTRLQVMQCKNVNRFFSISTAIFFTFP